MSFLASSDNLSILHLCYATWNGSTFLAQSISSTTAMNGFELAYRPFAAGTSLTLAVSSSRIRMGHALATMAVCAPHLFSELGAQLHFGSSLIYLVGHHFSWFGESSEEEVSEEANTPIRLAGRLLSGLLGISQLGVSILFTSNYIGNNPATYEAFLIDTLTSTDHVPMSTLTKDFLRGTYLAGTYAVLGIGWSLSANLLWEVLFQNSAVGCRNVLTSFAVNLTTQVALHSIAYLLNSRGEALGDYMFVHGPMSAPVLAMILGARYLVQRGRGDIASIRNSKEDTTKKIE